MFPSYFNRTQKSFYNKKGNQYYLYNTVVPIINNIPRFENNASYASLFGEQWKMYKKTQLDSYTKIPISSDRLNRCLGEYKDDLNGKLILEAGCGAGRFTEILLQKGAYLVSSDLSSAVDVNLENCPLSDHHQIIQADINDMPYQDESFDMVICLGVIQHTPSPEQAIENLFKLVRRGGTLIIDHYTYTKSQFLRLAVFYRFYLRKKPSVQTIPYTERLVKKYLPWHKKFSHNRVMSILLNRISPVISYYKVFPELNDILQEEWALLDTHDSLTDWHKNFRNKKQIIRCLKDLDAIDICCQYGGNGVEARCNKK